MASPRPYEVFLSFAHVSMDVEALLHSCSAMSINTATARLLGVDLYYRPDKDVMLLGLRFDPFTTTQALLDRLRGEAEACGANVLELARLPDDERRRFRDEYLPKYPMQIAGLPSPLDAMTLMARDLGTPQIVFERTAVGSRPRGATSQPRPTL